MNQARWMTIAAVAAALLLAGRASAEPIGLPVADTAENGTQGGGGFTAGAALGLRNSSGSQFTTDAATFGIRGTYSIVDEFRMFGDMTVLDNKKYGTHLGLQVGALTPIPTDYTSLALRGTVYGSDGDRRDELGVTGMLLWSIQTPLESLSFYAGTGLDVKHDSFKNATGTKRSNELNPMLDGGTIIKLSPAVSLFAEILYDDQWAVAGGLRIMR